MTNLQKELTDKLLRKLKSTHEVVLDLNGNVKKSTLEMMVTDLKDTVSVLFDLTKKQCFDSLKHFKEWDERIGCTFVDYNSTPIKTFIGYLEKVIVIHHRNIPQKKIFIYYLIKLNDGFGYIKDNCRDMEKDGYSSTLINQYKNMSDDYEHSHEYKPSYSKILKVLFNDKFHWDLMNEYDQLTNETFLLK